MTVDMKKYFLVILAALLLAAAVGLPAAIHYQKKHDIQAVDGLVYTFIVGKVEANHDLLADTMTEEAGKNLKPGTHKFPGAAEEMGERYSIERYDNEYKNGILMYRVEFYRPYTDAEDFYNIVVVNRGSGWEIGSNVSIKRHVMEELIQGNKAETVHEWER